jgi:hypothetical protein
MRGWEDEMMGKGENKEKREWKNGSAREWENFRSEKEIVGENENMREWVNAGQPYEIPKGKFISNNFF